MEKVKNLFDVKKAVKMFGLAGMLYFASPDAAAQSFNELSADSTKKSGIELANYQQNSGEKSLEAMVDGNRLSFVADSSKGYQLTVKSKDGTITYFDINMDGSVDRVRGKYNDGAELDMNLPNPDSLSEEELNGQVGINVKAHNTTYRKGVKTVEDAARIATMTASGTQ